MRVNVYAEEMTDRIEVIKKEIEGQIFTGLRFYLALPASFVPDPNGNPQPAKISDVKQANHYQAPFIHRPGDDDSAAVTFWGKQDLRRLLTKALLVLDGHYGEESEKRGLRNLYDNRT